jgi:hypothetical protein
MELHLRCPSAGPTRAIDSKNVAHLPTLLRLARAAVDARIDLEIDFSAGDDPADPVNDADE